MRGALTLACVVGAAVLAAQTPFRSGVDVVRVAATVVDKDGRFVSGLTKDDFRIVDGGQEQQITVFNAGSEPVSLVFVVDISGSMRGPNYSRALDAFANMARRLGPSDQVMGCVFEAATSCSEWTTEAAAVLDVLRPIRPQGDSLLYDGIDRLLARVEEARHTKRALVIVSDGNVGGVHRTYREARNAVRRAEVLTYAIGVHPPTSPPAPFGDAPAPGTTWTVHQPTRPGEANISALRDLTDATGGRTFDARTPEDVTRAAKDIANELKQQYQLGYVMPRRADGKYHEIKVGVRSPQHEVRARRGYLARAVRGSS